VNMWNENAEWELERSERLIADAADWLLFAEEGDEVDRVYYEDLARQALAESDSIAEQADACVTTAEILGEI
jgi:hypothetical protein